MGIQALAKQRRILGYFFLLPSLIMLSTFLFYPVINSMIMSFTNWSGFGTDYKFVGFKNYIRIFTEMPEYWQALWVNFRFAFISSTIQTIFGFFLAFLVYNLTKRLQNFYKVALYLPVILPAAVVAVMWTFIYTPDFGLINQFLRSIGLGSLAKAWLGDYTTALGSIIVTNTWRYVGFTMVLYYVAMLNIPTEIVEASAVDGASKWRQLTSMFFPLTRGTTEINYILSIVGGMKAFDLFYLMTGGGPGTSTQVAGMLIYRTAFQSFKFSRALAMSIILFIMILIVTVISRTVLANRED